MITYFLIAFIGLWILFVNVMKLAEHREKIPENLRKPAIALVAFGALWDGLFNIFYGTIVFLALPDFKGAKWHFPLFTHRLRGLIREKKLDGPLDRYRYYLARFICRYVVEPWDTNHCGLKDS